MQNPAGNVRKLIKPRIFVVILRIMKDQFIRINRGGEDSITVKVKLSAQIIKAPEGGYISYCPALDLCSQGDTRPEARKNIIEATRLFIESCFNRGTLKDVLAECGFHPAGTKIRRRKNPSPPFAGEGRKITIPAEIPLMAH